MLIRIYAQYTATYAQYTAQYTAATYAQYTAQYTFYLPPPSNSGLLPRGRRHESGEGGDTQDTQFKTRNSGVCASVSDPLDVAISMTRFEVTKLRMTRF